MHVIVSQVKHVSEKRSQLNDIVMQLVADVEQHKGTLSQMNTSVDHLSRVVPRYESILEEINLKIEILEVKSSTGVYIWKVNELGRRYCETHIGKMTFLYSPPLYNSTHGYRICLRAYLYGDGYGKGTHISLFIVLMKSEYDDILSWPFHHHVTLSLINQNNPLSAEAAIMHTFVQNQKEAASRSQKIHSTSLLDSKNLYTLANEHLHRPSLTSGSKVQIHPERNETED